VPKARGGDVESEGGRERTSRESENLIGQGLNQKKSDFKGDYGSLSW